MSLSPTRQTLDRLRADGWTAAVVEQWIPGVKRTRDLFGFIDIIAIRGDETLAVQTTDVSNVSHRLRKIEADEHAAALAAVRAAGWRIVVHGWYPDGRCREVDVS